MFPAATVAPVVRNVVHRRLLALTFPPGVSRSDEIPHVSHVVIKVMRRFSRSVKAFNE